MMIVFPRKNYEETLRLGLETYCGRNGRCLAPFIWYSLPMICYIGFAFGGRIKEILRLKRRLEETR